MATAPGLTSRGCGPRDRKEMGGLRLNITPPASRSRPADLRAADDPIEAKQIDEIELRGVSRPVKIFAAGSSMTQVSHLPGSARGQ